MMKENTDLGKPVTQDTKSLKQYLFAAVLATEDLFLTANAYQDNQISG